MRCPTCKRPMTALFISYVCDYCDGLVQADRLYGGYVVWRGVLDGQPKEDYVFPTYAMAERYRRAAKLEQFPIREVLSETKFRWHLGRGAIKNLELADHPFTIYPDHRFEPGPYRAYLAPEPAEGRAA